MIGGLFLARRMKTYRLDTDATGVANLDIPLVSIEKIYIYPNDTDVGGWGEVALLYNKPESEGIIWAHLIPGGVWFQGPFISEQGYQFRVGFINCTPIFAIWVTVVYDDAEQVPPPVGVPAVPKRDPEMTLPIERRVAMR